MWSLISHWGILSIEIYNGQSYSNIPKNLCNLSQAYSSTDPPHHLPLILRPAQLVEVPGGGGVDHRQQEGDQRGSCSSHHLLCQEPKNWTLEVSRWAGEEPGEVQYLQGCVCLHGDPSLGKGGCCDKSRGWREAGFVSFKSLAISIPQGFLVLPYILLERQNWT